METLSPWLLVTLGFIVGTLGGFFGVGGAFLMTPMLNLLGFPMVQAIGTDLALMLGSSTVATLRHLRFGHVDVRLGVLMLAGTAPGVWLGKEAVFALATLGVADSAIRLIYILLLFGLAVYMLRDYFRRARTGAGPGARAMIRPLRRGPRIGPYIDLPRSGLRLSVWLPVGVGIATGFLAALLGVGGGFIRMPMLLYGLGVPTTVAIGTDLFEIVFSSAIGAYLYALEDAVHLPAAMTMLLGAVFGAQVGSYATLHVRGLRIRLYFALTVLAAGLGATLKQLSIAFGRPVLAEVATGLVLAATVAMTLFLVLRLALARRAVSAGRH